MISSDKHSVIKSHWKSSGGPSLDWRVFFNVLSLVSKSGRGTEAKGGFLRIFGDLYL